MLWLDAAFRVRQVDAAFLGLLGLASEQVPMDCSFADVVGIPEGFRTWVAESAVSPDAASAASGLPDTLSARLFACPWGGWLLCLSDRAEHAAGALGGLPAANGHQEVEAALQESEARFHALTELGSNWYWETDAEHRFTRIEAGRVASADFDHTAALGRTHWDLPCARASGDDWGRHQAILEARQPFRDFVFSRRDSDGSLRQVAISGEPMFAGHGASEDFIGYRGIGRDISAQVRAERELRLAASVFDHAAEAIVITDANATILKVNQAFTKITEYPADEVVGKQPSVLRSGCHAAEFYTEMWRQLGEQGRWIGEIVNRRRGGEEYPELLSISAIRGDRGEVENYMAIFTDTSQIKDAQETIERLSFFDSLTDLPNRRLFMDRLEQALVSADRRRSTVGVFLLDIDRLRTVNDSLGHDAGDALLRAFAARLRTAVRASDTIARHTGDQFALILTEIASVADLGMLAGQLIDALSLPFEVGGHVLPMSTSIGISVSDRDGRDAVTLVKCADMALHCAKEDGRNGFQFYQAGHDHASVERLLLEGNLRAALVREEFIVHYQPQIDVPSGRIFGVEALVRWRHPEMGLIGPDRFIPLAEESGHIVALGDWVLQTACRQARRWHDEGYPLTVAVNLSARQFKQKNLVERVEAALRESGLPASALDLELTESMVMHDPERVVATLHRLRDLGVSLSIDDFGTGYSSLAYLKRFPIDRLKIDRSFVSDIPNDADDMAIAQAVIALGRSLRLTVVAEGVETAGQAEFMRGQGCHGIQGYFFSPPVSPEALSGLLEYKNLGYENSLTLQ